MKKFNNKSGFTLIEIIVVLIIVGILAAIALPSLFSNVKKSRGGEALASLGPYKSQIEGCLQGHAGAEAAYCTSAQLSATFVATTNFTYAETVSPPSNGTPSWVLTANGQTPNFIPGTDEITLTRTTAGVITCQGLGSLAGIC